MGFGRPDLVFREANEAQQVEIGLGQRHSADAQDVAHEPLAQPIGGDGVPHRRPLRESRLDPSDLVICEAEGLQRRPADVRRLGEQALAAGVTLDGEEVHREARESLHRGGGQGRKQGAIAHLGDPERAGPGGWTQ